MDHTLSDFIIPPTSPSPLTRTKSIDSLCLHNSPITSNSPFPRSKSSTAIHAHQRPTKSILRRPNSPSKGSRARFFSPRDISVKSGDRNPSEDLVDHNGNLRARELVHEFEADAPPSNCHLSSRPTINTPRRQLAASPSIRRSAHLPRFTIPEPEELDIEPILPCNLISTSPPLSPPPPPPPIRSDLGSQSIISSTSLNFNQDTLSNIMDESAGFLADDTTWAGSGAQTTEQSIDLNHVAMMQVLASRSSKLGHNSKASTNHPRPTIYQRPSLVQFESVEEVDEASISVDVEKLVRDMKRTQECSMDHALNDETAPEYLHLDLSTTLERSLISTTPTLPPSSPLRALDHLHLSSPPKTTTPTEHPVDENLPEKPTQILSLPSKPHSLALVQPLGSLTNQQPTPVLKSDSMVRKRASLLPPSKSKMKIESEPSQLRNRTSLLPPPGTTLRKRASLVPPSKTSGLGLGLPGRSKPKPSTATVPVSGGSPRVLKGRSSISSAMVSPRRVINGRVKVEGGRLMRPSNSSNEIGKPGRELGRIRPSVSSNEVGKPASSIGLGGRYQVGKMRPSVSSNDLNKLPSEVGRMRPSLSSNELLKPTSEISRMRPSSNESSRMKPLNEICKPIQEQGKINSSNVTNNFGKIRRSSIVNSNLIKPPSSSNLLKAPSTHELTRTQSLLSKPSNRNKTFNSSNELSRLPSTTTTTSMIGKPSSLCKRGSITTPGTTVGGGIIPSSSRTSISSNEFGVVVVKKDLSSHVPPTRRV